MDTFKLFYDNVDKVVRISSALVEEEKKDLVELNVLPEVKLDKQKKRKFTPAVVEAIRQKVGKLLLENLSYKTHMQIGFRML
ncbi:hypothetical protein EPI10_015667 [Gossypium australe]|uniref:Uncharacterized protein n=1 Tax=Gossypium australe TaxID=47621 RepID=A0A5B6VKT1_9ROSI|nr:hypothetical protein EPI10_015667 [Gossypium australe]